MKLSDFFYDLPQELIAQKPADKRDLSRLLLLDKNSGDICHDTFSNILNYLRHGDCLVFNDTRVIPARLYGYREGMKSPAEFVLLRNHGDDIWETLARPGRRALPGKVFTFGESKELTGEILYVGQGGNRFIKMRYNGIFMEILNRIGTIPLPPYIKNTSADISRYQTVYAKNEGSAAAPTAGLHFTHEILDEAAARGIRKAFVTLHIGLGTFRPVKTENVLEHKMHEEQYSLDEVNCKIINDTLIRGGRIIAVGTTSCRVLETAAGEDGLLRPGSGDTDIFIYPGYKFKIVDELITNFHLPESTLIMLVSALAGRDNILKAYSEAVEKKYRFFSFGDAMFIYNKEKMDERCHGI